MGRIIFLSAVAFLAYKYIARSNQRHQPLAPGDTKPVEVLPPAPGSDTSSKAAITAPASEPDSPKLPAPRSRAAEPDPSR